MYSVEFTQENGQDEYWLIWEDIGPYRVKRIDRFATYETAQEIANILNRERKI